MTIEPRFRFPWRFHRRRHARRQIVSVPLRPTSEEIARLYDRGLRRDQIAARCGVPVAVVCEALA